jgi:FAD/FMN-containing dehydrogenase
MAEVSAPIAELRQRLGASTVLVPDDGLERYERAARGASGVAAFVARPSTVDDVRAVVRWAFAEGIRLIAQGANTGLVGGSVPDATGRVGVLSLERLVGGLVVDPIDRTAIVPAGMTLSALEAAVAPHGLTLAIDIGADPSIGGMAATNAGGSRMVAYGDVRRRVLGVEVVLADADATVVDLLGPLRKDNTGLALHQLFVGSDGSLGVITRVAVELAVRPEATATAWVVPGSDLGVLELLAHAEHDGRAVLSAFELCSREAIDIALAVDADQADPFAGGDRPEVALLVELSGAGDVEGALVEMLASAPDGAIADARVVPPARSWGLRHAISPAMAVAGWVVGMDVSTPRSQLLAFRREARALVSERWPDATIADFGHAGDGGLHFNLVFPRERPPDAHEVEAIRGAVYRLAREHRGSFSAEHGIGPTNAEWWPDHVGAGARRLTAAIVELFDPAAILGHPALPYRSSRSHP